MMMHEHAHVHVKTDGVRTHTSLIGFARVFVP